MIKPSNLIEVYYLPVAEAGYDTDLNDALKLLDREETDRYHRFKVERARISFLQARRICKHVLANKLSKKTEDIILHYSANGKPFLTNHPGTHFSLSHCKSAIAFAVAPFNIGIDVEEIHHRGKPWEKTKDFINQNAALTVAKMQSQKNKQDMFALYWTCIESLVKLNDSDIFKERKNFCPLLDEITLTKKRVPYELSAVFSYRFDSASRLSLASEHPDPEVRIYRWHTPEHWEHLPVTKDRI